MNSITKLIVVAFWALALLLSCVETETKRTTKKVDVSKVQLYNVSLEKPRLRISLAIPDYIEVDITDMLYVGIDDGVNRYGFDGSAFGADTGESAGYLHTPWVNTPDSGQAVVSFHLALENGAVLVSDRFTVDLQSDCFWEMEVGIADHDPCSQLSELATCRSYALPRDIEASGNGQLYIALHEHQISNSTGL